MTDAKPIVVIGILGSTLDAGYLPDRWKRWRPTVGICQQPQLRVARFEMLCDRHVVKLSQVVRDDIALVSPDTQVNLHHVPFRDPWAFEDVYTGLHDFATSYQFDPEKEDYLLHITTGTHVAQICMFLLTEARYLPGKLLQTSPPKFSNQRRRRANQLQSQEHITKQARQKGESDNDTADDTPSPAIYSMMAGDHRIIDLDLSKYDRLATRFAREQQTSLSFLKAGIPTQSSVFNQFIQQLEQVVINTSDPILLTGPTGAGKSALARRINELKKTRRQIAGRLVEVNCATLRGDSAMSTLFGHKRGAFTGAVSDRPGLLREANQGMLFLDEIGDLGLDEQAMLLHALEEKSFLPVGSDREVQSDFQLVCGTNRDLSQRVKEGLFREDLLARINLWPFKLPGLAQRQEDIEPNLDYELAKFAQRSGKQVTFNAQARQAFLDFARSPAATWPGNFRDFSAAITRMATLATTGRINVELVAQETARLQQAWQSTTPTPHHDALLIEIIGEEKLAEVDLFDRAQLAMTIQTCQRSRTLSEAGRTLFAISRTSRKTTNDADRLRKYLAKFELTWQDVRQS